MYCVQSRDLSTCLGFPKHLLRPSLSQFIDWLVQFASSLKPWCWPPGQLLEQLHLSSCSCVLASEWWKELSWWPRLQAHRLRVHCGSSLISTTVHTLLWLSFRLWCFYVLEFSSGWLWMVSVCNLVVALHNLFVVYQVLLYSTCKSVGDTYSLSTS